MPDFVSYRAGSRTNWGTTKIGDLTADEITLGCVLRIADAIEKLTQSYDAMRLDRDHHKRQKERVEAERKRLARSNAALRGHLKRAKGDA